ncbi:regulatory protein RecX [Desertivirga brevis]|uniref:regulatory protein RecX n=1 Tax=Desertivirga brevis TaxID=2810310 RepID=UPI0034E2A006
MKSEKIAPLDKKDALLKAEHFCAYQERSHQEVRDKLYSFKLTTPEVEELISQLIENNFLNEERFAIAYANGKFRMKGWGKLKIKQGLKLKRVSPKLIELALRQLDGNEYLGKLKGILEKKDASLKEADTFKRRQKLVNFALSKGYEKDLILDLLTIK